MGRRRAYLVSSEMLETAFSGRDEEGFKAKEK
jgi:hypothetical protein